ncbi:MAG TPA: 2'-5' RNA ligase family protein [Marmoricola sp.]|nr:2'-5' RNA ligase family protein [Marmoricola sp.]
MALTVCLLPDARTDAVVRRLWRRLESAGVPTLLSHTHGRHVPHLTYAALRDGRVEDVLELLGTLPAQPPLLLHLDALGMFRRSRCWLAPAVTAELVTRQEAVVAVLRAAGVELHRHYEPGSWVPHLTLAPRLHLTDLPTVAAAVYDVLPVTATMATAAVVDTSDGSRHPLPHVV